MAKKICLIDDEKDFTDLAGTLLRMHGFEIAVFNSSVEALEHLKDTTYDAILLDLMMPQMDGLRLINKLRAMKAYDKVPLFAVSCKDLTDDERKSLLVNNIHFVPKPFEARRLVELIREALAAA